VFDEAVLHQFGGHRIGQREIWAARRLFRKTFDMVGALRGIHRGNRRVAIR